MWVLLPALLGCPSPHRYPDGTGLAGQLEREVIALKQRVRALEADLATCGTTDEGSLYAELHQVFSGSEVEVAQRGPATVITVRVSHLYSDPYSLTFREEADRNLDLIATALALHPEYDVLVTGHTDDRTILPPHLGRPLDPLALSLALARSLADRLSERYELDAARFTISGRGDRAPVASNDLDHGRDANARLELALSRPHAP